MLKLFVSFVFVLSLLSANDKINAKNSGTTAGQSAISKYGSKNKVNANMSAPLQGAGQMTSVDGKTAFNAKIESCAENNNGIKLVFAPQSGGLLNVQINQDLNATGGYDYSTSFNGIEKICSGGYGLSNAKYYKYKFEPSTKKITSYEVVKSEMGGCFCISTACQYSGYSQNLADKITGDIIGVIGSSGIANYQVGINKYEEANKTYFLYVKNNSSCRDSNLGNSYTNTNPTTYYNSQSIPPVDLADVALKDGNRSDSLYYATSNQNSTVINTLNGGANHNITMKNIQICTIFKTPYTDINGNIKIEIKDNCQANYSCPLDREEICDPFGKNCIDRILNRKLTSYNIPTQCQNYNENYQVCANGSNITSVPKVGATANIYSSSGNGYFYTKRYYDCGTQTVSHDASKTNNTLDSVSKSGSKINYQDFNGQPQNIELGEFENCQIRYCRVKVGTKHTQVYTDGTSNVSTKDGVSTTDYEFKKCNQLANQSYTCPLESGETLLDSCSCNIGMGAAGLAIGYAKAVEDAVKDFTCSSN